MVGATAASGAPGVIVTVDGDSAIPPYEQIRGQIETMVRAGTLKAGAQLPPIRRLAGDLGVASGTVARAYRELEAAEILITRGRHGTQVADVPPGYTAAQRRALLTEAARTYAGMGRQMGVGDDELVAALRTELSNRTNYEGAAPPIGATPYSPPAPSR